jgi:hypothetical protein
VGIPHPLSSTMEAGMSGGPTQVPRKLCRRKIHDPSSYITRYMNEIVNRGLIGFAYCCNGFVILVTYRWKQCMNHNIAHSGLKISINMYPPN